MNDRNYLENNCTGSCARTAIWITRRASAGKYFLSLADSRVAIRIHYLVANIFSKVVKHITSILVGIGLLLDLFGAVIVLGADWRFLQKWLVTTGKKTRKYGETPVVGFFFRRLSYLYGLDCVEKKLLRGRLEDVNWTKNNPPLNQDEDGFKALKRILTEELDVLEQFNRVSVDLIQKGHTTRPKVDRAYVNTSILTVLEARRKSGIEPWYLHDNIDSAPYQKVERAIDERKNSIVLGIGAKLLITGFSIQLAVQLIDILSVV